MTVIKLCGIAVIGVCAALIMRAAKSELAIPVGVITCVIILASAISSMYPIVAFAEGLSRENSYSLYFSAVLKALGIGITAQTAADICRDNGGGSGIKTGVCRQGGHTFARATCGTRNFVSGAKNT